MPNSRLSAQNSAEDSGKMPIVSPKSRKPSPPKPPTIAENRPPPARIGQNCPNSRENAQHSPERSGILDLPKMPKRHSGIFRPSLVPGRAGRAARAAAAHRRGCARRDHHVVRLAARRRRRAAGRPGVVLLHTGRGSCHPQPQGAHHAGGAVQVDPIGPTLKAPGSKRLKL